MCYNRAFPHAYADLHCALAMDFQRVTLSTYLRLSAGLSSLVVILLDLPVTRYVREIAHLHRDYF
jgi:hypothetical protein